MKIVIKALQDFSVQMRGSISVTVSQNRGQCGPTDDTALDNMSGLISNILSLLPMNFVSSYG